MSELEQIVKKLEAIEKAFGNWGLIIIISIVVLLYFSNLYAKSFFSKWGGRVINRELEKYKSDLSLTVSKTIVDHIGILSKEINEIKNRIEKKTTKEIIYHKEKINLLRTSFDLFIEIYLSINSFNTVDIEKIEIEKLLLDFYTLQNKMTQFKITIFKFSLYNDLANAKGCLLELYNLMEKNCLPKIKEYKKEIEDYKNMVDMVESKKSVNSLKYKLEKKHLEFISNLSSEIHSIQIIFEEKINQYQKEYLNQLKLEINE